MNSNKKMISVIKIIKLEIFNLVFSEDKNFLLSNRHVHKKCKKDAIVMIIKRAFKILTLVKFKIKLNM